MSERDALRFIERVAGDLELQSRLRAVDRGDLEKVARLGAAAGFDFDAGDLRRAFVTDWKLRRRFYDATADTPPPTEPERRSRS